MHREVHHSGGCAHSTAPNSVGDSSSFEGTQSGSADVASRRRCRVYGEASEASVPPPLLEQEEKHCQKPEEPTERCLEIRPCRCKLWFCSNCCVSKGISLLNRLLPVVATFTHCQMWTLTIDPQLFNSPLEAFLHVRSKRAFSNLVAALHEAGVLNSRRYFLVIEWHESGWPHYHLLVDSKFIDQKVVTALWGRNRPQNAGPVEENRPPFGMVRFTKTRFASSEAAAKYACKYLIKFPEGGYPDWVKDFPGQIRRYQTSQGFFPSDRVSKPVEIEEESTADQTEQADDEVTQLRRQRTIRQRMADCKQKCVLLLVEPIEQPDGTLKMERSFCAEIPETLEVVAQQLGKPVVGNRIFIREDDSRTMARLGVLDYWTPEPIRDRANYDPPRFDVFDTYNAAGVVQNA